MVRAVSAFCALVAGVLAVAVPAGAFEPTGIWEPSNRESRFEVTYCGESGDRLCAELIWIREDVQDARNTRYLNTYIFENARQTAPDVWEGGVHLEGFTIGGSLTQLSENAMRLRACALFVLCETVDLTRVQ